MATQIYCGGLRSKLCLRLRLKLRPAQAAFLLEDLRGSPFPFFLQGLMSVYTASGHSDLSPFLTPPDSDPLSFLGGSL